MRPTDLVTLASPLTTPAIPAESYPRYSRLLSPSIKNLTPFASPTNPTIPHILKIPHFFFYLLFIESTIKFYIYAQVYCTLLSLCKL